MSVYRQDPQLGYVPAIPEPFWLSRWSWRKFWFVWKPSCYVCKLEFNTRQEWDTHYVLNHIEQAGPQTQEEK